MKKTTVRLVWMATALVAGMASCKKDNTANEEETITSIIVKLKEQGTTTVRNFEFKDPDGPGGNPPTKFDSIQLVINKVYDCELQFWNDAKTPAENVTGEIETESRDHQVYYTPAAGAFTVTGLNNDAGGLPLGTTSLWRSGGTANVGTVRITLKHKPGIKAAGDPVSVGETDIDILFPVRIQ
jgi:hypothetical protein